MKGFLFVLVLGLSVNSLFAQSRHYSSQSMGMGSGGTAYVDGYHANFVNPANLMLKMHRPKNTVGIVGGLGIKAGGSLLNVSVYNKYLTTGLLIDGEIRENMLSEWFGRSQNNFRDVSADFSMVPFGFSHRSEKSAFSLATRVRVSQDFGINKGTAELLTYGLDSEIFNTPTPIDFRSNTVVFAEMSVGYARHIITLPEVLFAKDIKVFAGIAPKYLHGIYTTSFDFNSTLHMQQPTDNEPFTIHHEFNYSLQTIGELSRQLQAYEAAYNQDNEAEFGDYIDYGGDDLGEKQASGFGVDLGATVEMDITSIPIPLFMDKVKTLRISMSFTDLGRLNFDQSASSIYAEGDFKYVGAEDQDDFNTFFDNLADSLEKDVYGKFNSQEKDAVTYSLPAMYNLGSSLEMGNLLLALDLGFGFNNNGANSRRMSMNLGTQYKFFGFLPLRLGTRIGGYSSASYSAGFGLDFNNFEFTFGLSTVNNSENYGTSAGVAWSGLVIRF
ncbi:MAG: DUF5723 family protein [Balneolaceae bacterium]